jgi:6-pyruvoyltetrahydropterin/6-carboxytetrahydropterin synthase
MQNPKREIYTTLHIYKQNFKFSSGHFLIFDDQHAERLHGHNYQVYLQISFSSNSENMKTQGFCIDFNEIKKWLKARLDQWDEMVLLPEHHPDFKFTEEGPSLHVRFRERYYVFPKNEVVRLPIVNTSVELLSQIIAEETLKEFAPQGAKEVEIRVEETPGQGATSRAVVG